MPAGTNSFLMPPLAEEIIDATRGFFQKLTKRKAVRLRTASGHLFNDMKLTDLRGPTYCSLCDDLIYYPQGKSCKQCKLVIHEKCLGFLSFRCVKSITKKHAPKHQFKEKSFAKFTYCNHCGLLLTGFYKQGLSCTQDNCGMNIHSNCENLVCRPCRFSTDDHDLLGNNYDLSDLSIDRYFDLMSVLGEGNFSKVYLAKLKNRNEKFAIKIIEKSNRIIISDPESALTEMRVLQLGRYHPFLVIGHCCFQSKERLFFVMEYVEGSDLLYHLRKRKKFKEDWCRFYSAEIVLAFKFLHSQGLVYRDLKLENVIIDKEGHIKLIDFGMSKFLDRAIDMKTRTFCGTPLYISPEVIKELDYDFSVDWWALGVLMYELLVGCGPFGSEDESDTDELYQDIVGKDIIIPSFLTDEARHVLASFLTRDPSYRLGHNVGDVFTHPFFMFHDEDGDRKHRWEDIKMKLIKPPFQSSTEISRELYESRLELEATGSQESSRLTEFSELTLQGFKYCSDSFESLLVI